MFERSLSPVMLKGEPVKKPMRSGQQSKLVLEP
jgi:hypothetical protein